MVPPLDRREKRRDGLLSQPVDQIDVLRMLAHRVDHVGNQCVTGSLIAWSTLLSSTPASRYLSILEITPNTTISPIVKRIR